MKYYEFIMSALAWLNARSNIGMAIVSSPTYHNSRRTGPARPASMKQAGPDTVETLHFFGGKLSQPSPSQE